MEKQQQGVSVEAAANRIYQNVASIQAGITFFQEQVTRLLAENAKLTARIVELEKAPKKDGKGAA